MTHTRFRLIPLIAVLALIYGAALPAPAAAQAGGVQIAPVLVAMTPERPISSLRIRNGRDEPIAFEVDAYRWTQVDGQDRLTPAPDLIVAPGVFEVAPGAEQLLRVGLRQPATDRESAYRIVLRELPREHESGVALGFSLELSLPVFVTPAGAAATLETHRIGDELTLANDGESYTQIALFAGEERIPSPRYLLAGSSATIAVANNLPVRLLAYDAAGANTQHMLEPDAPRARTDVR